VELGWDHFNARNEQERPQGKTIQNLTDHLIGKEVAIKVIANGEQDHPKESTERGEDGVKEDEPKVVGGGEGCLGHACSQGKGLDPLVHEEGDQEGYQLFSGALRYHSETFQEAMHGQGNNENDSLKLTSI